MKQVTQTQRNGHIRVEEVPPPALRPGGVLVRTAYSLISAGTERAKVELAQKSLVGKARARPEQARQVLEVLHQQGPLATYRKVMNRLASLQPLGYSCSGVVIAVGPGAEEFQVGDWVACAGAGYANHAEINFVPRNLCVKVPPEVSLEEAAFTTLGAIALQGVRQADVHVGETVAVIGLGLVGLLTVQILKAAGCRVLGMDLNPDRCQLAESLGCDFTATNGSQLATRNSQLTGGYGADAVIITAATSSNEPVKLAGRICRDKGRVVVVGAVGMTIPRQVYYEKELELRLSRSYGPGRYDPEYEEKGHDYPIGYVRWTEKRNMEAFLHLIAEGKVNVRPLITHRFPIARAAEAYRLITEGNEPYLAVLLEYDVRGGEGEKGREGEKEIHPLTPSPPHPLGTQSRVVLNERLHVSTAVRVGIIGAGNFAQDVLIPALKATKGVRLRGVVTASGLSARSVAERFGFEYAASDPAEIFNDPDVDAVIIATRHNTHARFVIEALKAGKPVFVEKPLALNEGELRDIVEEWNRSEKPFVQVGFNRRFAPATQAVLGFFRNRKQPLVIHCRVNAGYLPRDHWLHDPDVGGGRIIGEGCHFVDLLLFLVKMEPVEVYAQALPDNGLYKQDNVSVQIRFADGSIATLHYLANGDKRVGKERIEVFGEGAVAIIDDFRRVLLSRGGKKRRLGHWWSSPDKGHRAEIKAFLEAVRSKGSSPVPFEEAIQSMWVTFKILESLHCGKPVSVANSPLHSTSDD